MRKEITTAPNKVIALDELVAAHGIIIEDMLPRIEYHLSGLEGVEGIQGQKAKVCMYWFRRFSEDIRGHFAFEEQELFPLIRNDRSDLSSRAISFIHDHENHESRLQLLLVVLQEELHLLSGDLAYELSLSSLRQLSELLREHARIEDEVFLDLINR